MCDLENMLRLGPYQHYKKLKGYCGNIFQSLDLTAFSYARIYREGRSFTLCSNPEHYEYYYLNNVFKNDPCCNRSKSLLQPINLWGGILNLDDPLQRLVYEQQVKDNLFNGVCIKIETNFGYETYDFATNIKNISALSKLINNLSLIKNFVNEFKLDYSCVIERNRDNFIDLYELIGQDFFQNNNNKAEETDIVKKSLEKNIEVKLSNREDQCLFYLSKGYTSKQIARKIKLEPRTIDNYIERIKSKFGCKTRIELLTELSEKEKF